MSHRHSSKLFVLSFVVIILSLTSGLSCSDDKCTGYSQEPSYNRTYIRDYAYLEKRIFDLGYPADFQPGDSVVTLLVYEQVNTRQEPEGLPAYLAVDPNDTSMFLPENIDLRSMGGVKEVAPESCTYFNECGRNRHYVVFEPRRPLHKALGIYMEVDRANGSTDTIGHIDDTLLLKLLYHDAPQPQYQTWNLMWRNCYSIPGEINWDDIDIKVFYGLPGLEGSIHTCECQISNGKAERFIEVLGLDQYNTDDQKFPDGRFDNRCEVFIPEWGLLILPHQKPFASDTTFMDANGVSTSELLYKVPQIYEYNSQMERVMNSQYYIEISTRVGASQPSAAVLPCNCVD